MLPAPESSPKSPVHPVRRIALQLATVAACLAPLAACGGGDDPTGPPPPEERIDRIEVTPAADTLTALGATESLSATAFDAEGDPISGVDFTWSSTDPSVAPVDDQGVVEAASNGTASIEASAGGVTGSADLAVIQQVEAVSVSPSSATLTTVGDTARFSASATDANGNAVSDAAIVWASENHAVATVDSSGLATSRGDGEATITATAQDVPGHATLTVDQTIDALVFRTEPTDATAGEAMDPAVQVAVLDADGNVVEDAGADVTLAIGTNPAGGSLGGARTVSTVNGVATFSNVWVDVAATGYTLEATAGGATSATSQSFDISPGAADQLAFATGPSDAIAGQAISPAVEVEVRDEFGNLVTGSSASVSVALGTNPTGATLGGTTTVSASSGVAAFDDLSLTVAASGYTLQVSASGLVGQTSGSFQVTPAAASQLAFADQPSDVEGQETISPAVLVRVKDDFGNLVTTSSATVSLALDEDPTGGDAALLGTTSVGVFLGQARFDDLSVDLPGDGFTLEATASGLRPDTSTAFDVDLTFVQDDAGGAHTCGVTVADHAYCWGHNDVGQLGDGTTTDSSTPIPVAGGHAFSQVSAGPVHTCGVTTSGDVFCWGKNGDGRLGDGTTTGSTTPVAVSTTEVFSQVSAGGSTNVGTGHTCGVTRLTTSGGNEVLCWGANGEGQLGNGTTTDQLDPARVSTTEAFSQVSAGAAHSCAVSTSDEVFCWGGNDSGELGDGSTTGSTTPVAVSTTETFSQVSAGGRFLALFGTRGHTCGVATGGSCWGDNDFGQLGDGSTTDSSSPVFVFDGGSVVQTSAGAAHTCGVRGNGQALCWGDNRSGQLGDGTTSGSTTPLVVSTTETFVQLSAGGNHTCGVTPAGKAFCWGFNANGQLGDGTTIERHIPVQVVQ